VKQIDDNEAGAAGAVASLRWLQTDIGSRFISNLYNTNLIQQWKARHGKDAHDFSQATLNEAFLAMEDQMLSEDPKPEDFSEPEPTPPPPPTDAELYGPWKDLTKQMVLKMTGSEMRFAGKDPRFSRKVDSLQITKAELRKG
jgi:hypothetical protein